MDYSLFIIGVFFGIISGLIPDLHSNTIIAIVSSLGIEKEAMGALIIAIFSSHMVVSFIPSIFFGIPSDSSIVSVLPGQRMTKEGKGITALKIILVSILVSTLLSVLLFYPSLGIYPLVYSAIKPYVGYMLILFSAILIYHSKNKFLSLCIFILAGLLGVFSFNLKMYDVFLPLFSGFFAIPAILTYERGTKMKKQQDKEIKPGFWKYILLGVLLGFAADLLPVIGAPSQIATFTGVFMPINTEGYLATISAISSSESIFSFSTSASIDKSRMGATELLSRYTDIGGNLVEVLVLFLISVAITVGIIHLFRKLIGRLAEIDFSKFNILLAFYLVAIVFILNGFMGLVILALSSAVGYLTIKLEVSRTTLMGSIILPTILLLFKIFMF